MMVGGKSKLVAKFWLRSSCHTWKGAHAVRQGRSIDRNKGVDWLSLLTI